MKFYIGSGLKNCKEVDYYSESLKENGWEQTYDWVKNAGCSSAEDIKQCAKAESQGILESDVVIILLPAGRGAHIELGMAMALNKKIFLCGASEEFDFENTVAFYELPEVIKLTGTADENINEILKIGNIF